MYSWFLEVGCMLEMVDKSFHKQPVECQNSNSDDNVCLVQGCNLLAVPVVFLTHLSFLRPEVIWIFIKWTII